MAEPTEDEEKLVFTRQIVGAEDLAFGFGSVSQIREGENTTISLIQLIVFSSQSKCLTIYGFI